MATFTPKELEISNKSYTNKDFEAIYLELLELAEKISKRFSPVNANEADPFIVLLKLVSAVADKINYNVDKNILERFLLSCTQESSMREMTDMLGYNMRYYRSASTSVVFKYRFSDEDKNKDGEPITSITIPVFSIVSNGENIQYVTLGNTTIQKVEGGCSPSVKVIQGKLKDFEILGSKSIQLENLNANNRLYLPEVMIAENGIFISTIANAGAYGPEMWVKSDNLNTETYGTLVYKFGFDSVRNLPYLDFPEWIGDIIGDGLYIKYLVTDGTSGNVAAKGLKKVIRASSNDRIDDENIFVINSSSASNGAEPETIDEAYTGFKKVIGTFDTLVTCRDYANAIYNLLNDYGNPYVSNVQVGDRRTDINYSCDVLTATSEGAQVKTIISTGTDGETPKILPYDLCVYALKPLTTTSYISIDDEGGYNKAYGLMKNATDFNNIAYKLNDLKTLSHIYKNISSTDIGYIQNNYRLDATVNTVRKVNKLEEAEILANINNALIAKYNSRTLQFGYEIPYDALLATIEGADSRIKSVSLQEPEQEAKVVFGNNKVESLFDSNGNATNALKFIIARNALAGRIELFDYDKDFDYNFYQERARKTENVVEAATFCNLPEFKAKEEEKTYTLNQNEVVQFLAPKLHTDITYPYGVNYYLELSEGKTCIAKNSEYKLKSGDKIIFNYKNNNDEDRSVIYMADSDSKIQTKIQIIKPNFDLYTTAARQDHESPTIKSASGMASGITVDNISYNYNYTNFSFYTLKPNQTIECREVVTNKLETTQKCYWLTNQYNNKIRWKRVDLEDETSPYEYTYILNDGEYFFYSDINLTSLYAFGPGSCLTLTCSTADAEQLQQEWTHNNYIEIDKINTDGLRALNDYCITKMFNNSTFKLEIFENEIITITAGDTLKISNNSDASFKISNNDFTAIPSGVVVSYKFKDASDEEMVSFIDLPDRSTLESESNLGWQVRALLDLNAGPGKKQTLDGNQVIKFYPGLYDEQSKKFVSYYDITKSEDASVVKLSASANDSFELTMPTVLGGGDRLNLQYLDLDLSYKCPSILKFVDRSNDAVESNLLYMKKVNDKFYSVSFFEETKSKNENSNESTITINPRSYILNVSPVDSYNIVTVSSDITSKAASDYLNRKVYQYTNNDGQTRYYQAVRVCADLSDTEDTDAAKHNALDPSSHSYKWKEVTDVSPSPRMFMIYITGLDDKRSAKVMANVDAGSSIVKYNIDSEDNSNSNVTIPSTPTETTVLNMTFVEAYGDHYMHFTCADIPAFGFVKVNGTQAWSEYANGAFKVNVGDLTAGKTYNFEFVKDDATVATASYVYQPQTSPDPVNPGETVVIKTEDFKVPEQPYGAATVEGVDLIWHHIYVSNSTFTADSFEATLTKNGAAGVVTEKIFDTGDPANYHLRMHIQGTVNDNCVFELTFKKDGRAVATGTYTYTAPTTLDPVEPDPIEPTGHVSIDLTNGINIIKVTGSCEQLTLQASAVDNTNSTEVDDDALLKNITTLISGIKVCKGLNSALGINESEGDIISYIKSVFPEQFKQFFICADLDKTKEIEISKEYPLASAYSFYDSNNIANKWTLCKIDFASSNIRIARNSKQS